VDNPIFSTAFGGIQGSNDKESKDPRTQNLKGRLLREKGRRGTAVLVGMAVPADAELDLAAAEAEDRRIKLNFQKTKACQQKR
jgi:hypothetical protein